MSEGFEAHVARLRQAYAARRDALLAALAAHLPDGYPAPAPAGGYFLWVRHHGDRHQELLPRAEAAGVSFLPGSRFYMEAGRAANAAAAGVQPLPAAGADRGGGGWLRRFPRRPARAPIMALIRAVAKGREEVWCL